MKVFKSIGSDKKRRELEKFIEFLKSNELKICQFEKGHSCGYEWIPECWSPVDMNIFINEFINQKKEKG
jgi:hypothetical protein